MITDEEDGNGSVTRLTASKLHSFIGVHVFKASYSADRIASYRARITSFARLPSARLSICFRRRHSSALFLQRAVTTSIPTGCATAAISFVRSENAPLCAYFVASCLTERSANWLTNCVALAMP